MDVRAYFSDIHKVILDAFDQSESEIVSATAWFTDPELFNFLCKRAALGIKVSIAVVDDEINRGPRGLNFQRLTDLGGNVTYVPSGSSDEPLMHHKFCVIDGRNIITGSYNWSKRARNNDENITVITDAPELAQQYLAAFRELSARCRPGQPINIDSQAVRRRLELVKNLLLLEEYEGIGEHLEKLHPAASDPDIDKILSAFNTADFTRTLELIEICLKKPTALVQSDLIEIPRLKLQLQTLEFRLESVSEEKDELERRLLLFSQQHDEAFGDLIQQILRERARLARLRAELTAGCEDMEEAKVEADVADERYREYKKQYDASRETTSIVELEEHEEAELKRLYRRSCSLCHPDKVTDSQKINATEAFKALQDAYRKNDLDRVREIYDALKAGDSLVPSSTVLSEVDDLKAVIADMELKLALLLKELRALRESGGVKLMVSVCSAMTSWERYVVQRRSELEDELVSIEEEIADYRERLFDE